MMSKNRYLAVALSPVLAISVAARSAEPAGCTAQSGSQTAALVELYTSEGCSSCPPADRQLGTLGKMLSPGAVAVPIALHVNYWDSIGWRDPFAQPAFSERHEQRVHQNHHTIVYTPHFFVNGQEIRSGSLALGAAIYGANALPPRASITARVEPQGDRLIRVEVSAETVPGTGPAALFVALAQNGLVSDVTRGENRGVRLEHDHVVRDWSGPIALAGGAAHIEHRFPLPAGADPREFELVAFVEEAQSGTVLQALATGACAAAAHGRAGMVYVPARGRQPAHTMPATGLAIDTTAMPRSD
jgi:hypothetical protein